MAQPTATTLRGINLGFCVRLLSAGRLLVSPPTPAHDLSPRRAHAAPPRPCPGEVPDRCNYLQTTHTQSYIQPYMTF